jgi:hypothetical protein
MRRCGVLPQDLRGLCARHVRSSERRMRWPDGQLRRLCSPYDLRRRRREPVRRWTLQHADVRRARQYVRLVAGRMRRHVDVRRLRRSADVRRWRHGRSVWKLRVRPTDMRRTWIYVRLMGRRMRRHGELRRLRVSAIVRRRGCGWQVRSLLTTCRRCARQHQRERGPGARGRSGVSLGERDARALSAVSRTGHLASGEGTRSRSRASPSRSLARSKQRSTERHAQRNRNAVVKAWRTRAHGRRALPRARTHRVEREREQVGIVVRLFGRRVSAEVPRVGVHAPSLRRTTWRKGIAVHNDAGRAIISRPPRGGDR